MARRSEAVGKRSLDGSADGGAAGSPPAPRSGPGRRRHRRAAVAVAALAAMLATGTGGISASTSKVAGRDTAETPTVRQPQDRPAGHRRMLDLLERIGERAPTYYPFHRQLQQARSAYEALPGDAPPRRKLQALGRLSQAELTTGRLSASIEHMGEIEGLLAGLPLEARGRFQLMVHYYLGVAHLRRSVVVDDVRDPDADSRILPLRGGAVHPGSADTREAIEHLTAFLRLVTPDHPSAIGVRWLLNLAHMTLGEYPEGVPPRHRIDPSVFTSDGTFPRFDNVAPEAGLDTVSLAGGAVVDDLDGDGLLDVATSTLETTGQLRLFRNGGDGPFREVTEEAGVVGIVGGLNMTHADYDDDGDLDILVLRGGWLGRSGQHPNSLLRNDGDLTFTDVTFEAGLGEVHYPTQVAAWADYDNDGDLDLFVGNEARPEERFSCQLFRNEGDGTFVDVAAEAGVENLRYTKGATWGDYDDDGWIDLYVSNFGGDNRLYHNERDGTFTDVAGEAGVNGPSSGFATWFWDVDNDGDLDLLANSYRLPTAEQSGGIPDVWYVAASRMGLEHPAEVPRLYLGDGAGGFTDVAGAWGIDEVTLPMGSNFGDLDGDGYLDYYLGTGYPGFEGMIPNVMYRNVDGRRFADVTYSGGFGHLEKGHGVAFADIDNDGDQDVFEQMGGLYPGGEFADALFENPGFGHHWIAIELRGRESNRYGVGARIRVVLPAGDPGAENGGEAASRQIFRQVGAGGSFGENPFRTEIGLGDADRIELLEVRWPGAGTQTFRDLDVDRFLRITEGDAAVEELERPSVTLGEGPGGS